MSEHTYSLSFNKLFSISSYYSNTVQITQLYTKPELDSDTRQIYPQVGLGIGLILIPKCCDSYYYTVLHNNITRGPSNPELKKLRLDPFVTVEV